MGGNRKPDRNVDVSVQGKGVGVVVKGVRQSDVAKTVKRLKESNEEVINIKVKGVEKIDILNPDGTIDQTVFGGKNLT